MSLNPVQERLVGEIDEEYKEELREEEKIVEALLFAMGRAVSREEIATALGTGPEAAEEAAERLYRSYRERNGGILIRRLEESYQMYTNPAQFEALIRVAKHPKKPVMTDVVMETLAIVAYRQPVTKAEIEKIRGVKSDHAVNRLVEYGLIRRILTVCVPIPRLMTRFPPRRGKSPDTFFTKRRYCGVITPPIRGSRIIPPCRCPESTRSAPLRTASSS